MSESEIQHREWMVGRRDEFAIKLAFDSDPDRGAGAARSRSLSWGNIEIWVNGLNLCQHTEAGVTLDAVHWYMYPVLRWLVDSWDYLLHEERLPCRNAGRDAWQSMKKTSDAPPGLADQQAEQWEASWQNWWSRHCLLASREGGLFPDVYIRRFRNQVEFSWGPSGIAGKPEHYRFHASHGYARISPETVADCLCGVIENATAHLCKEAGDVDEYVRLKADFEALDLIDRSKHRLALASGFSDNGSTAVSQYSELLQSYRDASGDSQLGLGLQDQHSKVVIEEVPAVCLMFGCVAPTISKQDVQQLAKTVVDAQDQDSESIQMKNMVGEKPIRSTLQRPWDEGYELADAFHEALQDRFRSAPPVEIENIYRDFGIQLTEISLQDSTIRAVAIAGEHFKPTVAINSNYASQESHVRRFTMAHELCHLLHDRSYGTDLVMASGPWAPVDLEKRANAFAAMFLMPVELIEQILKHSQFDLTLTSDVWKMANELQVSFTALVEHLCNLAFIDEFDRDQMRLKEENVPHTSTN